MFLYMSHKWEGCEIPDIRLVGIEEPGAVIESSTTTVTRKQQDYVITGDQIVEGTVGVTESAPILTQPLPANVEVEKGATIM